MKATHAFLFLLLLGAADGQNASAPAASQQWFRVSEILISFKSNPSVSVRDAGPSQTPTPAEVTTARTRAEKARQEIVDGSPFALVAIKYSDGPTAKNGGDVGYFKGGMLSSEVEKELASLKLFQGSEIIRTKQGFVLVQATDRRLSEADPTKEIASAEERWATAYAEDVKNTIMDKWHSLMPREVMVSAQKRGFTVIAFRILSNGQAVLVNIEKSSWDKDMDQAAMNAIKQSQPFPPFSSEFGSCCVNVRISFLYNPPPH